MSDEQVFDLLKGSDQLYQFASSFNFEKGLVLSQVSNGISVMDVDNDVELHDDSILSLTDETLPREIVVEQYVHVYLL